MTAGGLRDVDDETAFQRGLEARRASPHMQDVRCVGASDVDEPCVDRCQARAATRASAISWAIARMTAASSPSIMTRAFISVPE